MINDSRITAAILSYLIAHPEGAQNTEVQQHLNLTVPGAKESDYRDWTAWHTLQKLHKVGLVTDNGVSGKGRLWFPVLAESMAVAK